MTDPQQDKINIVVAMDFSDALIEQMRAVSPRLNITRHFPEVPESAWADVEVLYTIRNYPEPENAPRLRWVQLHFAGLDRALTKRIIQTEDILVTSASGIHAQQMANYCLMMMLAFNYRLPLLLEHQRRVLWDADRHQIFDPLDMHRQTVGIVGYGSIGRELARLCQALGMRVLASKRNVKQPAISAGEYSPPGTGDPQGEIPDRLYPGTAVATMAAESDYLVVTTPLTPQTRHLIDETVLKAMKPGAILINVARGEVVDEKALISALAAERIGGAALDVFEEEPLPSGSPLWNLPNVILTPHISGNSQHYHEKAAELFIENLRRYMDKRPLLNALNRDAGY